MNVVDVVVIVIVDVCFALIVEIAAGEGVGEGMDAI